MRAVLSSTILNPELGLSPKLGLNPTLGLTLNSACMQQPLPLAGHLFGSPLALAAAADCQPTISAAPLCPLSMLLDRELRSTAHQVTGSTTSTTSC
mmetsp:Transcript_9163/g.19633  ORF Transcript_9163/g.19633 Transcript_9163/m.19633 type:complete len:96 (-) Transcript_9163:93-380(-)